MAIAEPTSDALTGISADEDSLLDRAFGRMFSRLFVFTLLFEDTEIEERYFEVDERSRVLSVSAGGCGIAGLLARRPERIDAVDTNRHHLALTALKVTGARTLESYDDFYRLFGHGKHPEARRLVAALSKHLPEWARKYWTRNSRIFERGLYEHGILSAGTRLMRRGLGVDEAWLRARFSLSPEKRREEGRRIYENLLEKPLARLMVNSPLLLIAQGINFRQKERNLRNCGTTDMREVIYHFIDRIAATDLETNWILWYGIIGHFNHEHPEAVPPYLRRRNHALSLGAPTTTEFHRESFLNVMKMARPGTWSHYSFSDAMDWMSDGAQRATLLEVLRTSRPGGLLLNRTVENVCLAAKHGLQHHFQLLEDVSRKAASEERSACFERVDLYRIVH